MIDVHSSHAMVMMGERTSFADTSSDLQRKLGSLMRTPPTTMQTFTHLTPKMDLQAIANAMDPQSQVTLEMCQFIIDEIKCNQKRGCRSPQRG